MLFPAGQVVPVLADKVAEVDVNKVAQVLAKVVVRVDARVHAKETADKIATKGISYEIPLVALEDKKYGK